MSMPTPMTPLGATRKVKSDMRAAIVFPSHVRRTFTQHPTDYTGELVRLLDDIATQTHNITAYIAENGETMQYGVVGTGEKLTSAFVTSNMYRALMHDGYACMINVKDREIPMVFPDYVPHGGYVVCLSPLDIDPLVDHNAICGTIFSIYKRKSAASLPGKFKDLKQNIGDQVAAGMCVYGTATVLYYTMGYGLYSFCLHPVATQYFLDPNAPLKLKNAETPLAIYGCPSIISSRSTHPLTPAMSLFCKRNTARWFNNGSITACTASFLRDGGFIFWPQLDLLCEAGPLAFMIEQAGGKVTNGHGIRILDLKAEDDFKTSTDFVAGMPDTVDKFQACVKEVGATDPSA